MIGGWLQLQLACLVIWLVASAGGDPRRCVRACRGLLIAAVCLPVAVALLEPAAPALALPPMAGAVISAEPVSQPPIAGPVPAAPVRIPSALWVLAVIACSVGWRWGRPLIQLIRLTRGSRPLHRIGRVRVVVAEVRCPTAAWLPGTAWVLLPPAIAAHPRRRWLAVRHELIHHRHRDPIWAHLWVLLEAITLANPLASLLRRRTTELEELAVDAAVLAHPRIDPHSYGRLLLAVAEASSGAALPASGLAAPLLKRRMQMLFRPRHARTPVALLGLLALGTLTASAVAIGGTQPRSALHQVDAATELPLRDHPLLWEQHQRLIDDGAASPSTLARYRALRASIEASAARHGVPPELAAVALVESRFHNHDRWAFPTPERERLDHPGAAGVWQFIPSTARRYGLTVDATTDERLDLALETDAAMRLLRDEHERFGDWLLALAAYNQGHDAVLRAIKEAGTDDPWALIEGEHLNRYVPTVLAGVLILAD